MAKYKTIIGRAETIDLPLLGLHEIPAKTDTGAYASSIHATHIREVEKPNGKKVLKFRLLSDHPGFSQDGQDEEFEVAKYKMVEVANSFGGKQYRYKIKMQVKIANKVFKAPFTLSDRSQKTFPVLLGRTVLNKRFIVDTEIVHADRQALKAKLKEWLARDDEDDEDKE